MNNYNKNLTYLLDLKGLSISQFEYTILIPKVKILEPSPNELIRIADYLNVTIDDLIRKSLRDYDHIKKSDIKLIILDVDGTMTDGGMYFTENGDQIKKYNTKDGMAIKGLTKANFQVGIISHGYKTKLVKDRADLLGIQNVYVGRESKTEVLNTWLKELNYSLDQVAFIGDDINDIEIMKIVGLSACPSDAVNSVKSISDIILNKAGGQACVREFIDNYISLT